MTDLMNGKEKYNVAWFNNYIEGLEDPAIPPLPKFEEVVESVLKTTEPEKKECIDIDVARTISAMEQFKPFGVLVADDVSSSVTTALKSLEKKGRVVHVDHAYWAKKK